MNEMKSPYQSMYLLLKQKEKGLSLPLASDIDSQTVNPE
uniref:Uncharacterized protein n=1 Tax=Arundo donax TaxID=35708 RepID=A0A0A9C414_ARUDO